jgi:hypothetical protein
MRRQAGDIVTVECDLSCGRRQSTGDGVEECSLASPIGTNDGAALASRHGEADAIDRAKRVERHNHIGQREDRF